MSDTPHGPIAAPHRPIATRTEFHDALREAFAEMAQVGCREAWLCDEDFADWPLNERAVIELLTHWAAAHRKLTVIARAYDDVVRRHPRWVDWRRRWSHIVECRAFVDAETGQIPTLLLASELVAVRLIDPLRHRGALSRDPADLLRHRELADAVSQRSIESFAPTMLGL
jgi:hypothetical protein